MVNHPNRSTLNGKLCVKRQDGAWTTVDKTISKYLADLGLPEGRGDGPFDTARGILAAAYYGYAVRGENGRARSLLEVSGDVYDMWISGEPIPEAVDASEGSTAVLRAFVDPRDGSINHAALREAALLYLEKHR
ncbi:hypothetical protein [Zavarzinia sp.]|uniref:hypothetical protein n=1 Tax=Zavarzinia sp. TaxID=2027920 RepID=UPI003BB53C03